MLSTVALSVKYKATISQAVLFDAHPYVFVQISLEQKHNRNSPSVPICDESASRQHGGCGGTPFAWRKCFHLLIIPFHLIAVIAFGRYDDDMTLTYDILK
jgi:hypothetical protein